MMGGFLVARDRGLYDRSAQALVAMGAISTLDVRGQGVVQFTDDAGHLFTLYERVPEGTEWEFSEGPFTSAAGVEPPDVELTIACPFECRWPDLAARLINSIARSAESPTWVLDGDGMIWVAEAVDPMRIVL